jgi:hypothetical protein
MASMIHKGSAPATLPELNLFSLPDTQTAVIERKFVVVYPIAPPGINSIPQFNVSGAGKDYIDTEKSLLHVKLKFNKISKRHKRSNTSNHPVRRVKRTATEETRDVDNKEETTNPPVETIPAPPTGGGGGQEDIDAEILDGAGSPADLIYPINCIHQTLWRQIDVEANNVNLVKANNLNPYEVMMKVLLRYGIDAKTTHLEGMGFYSEEADMLYIIGLDGRLSVIKRWELYSGGKTVDLEGPLLIDALQLGGRPLLNGINLTFKFYPSDKAFFTMCKMDEDEYTLEIVDIYLKICKVKVADSIILGHSVALEESNAVYPFTRCDTKSFTYSKGLSNICVDDLFHHRVPSRIVFGMVSAQAFNGDVSKNPFNFKHYYIADIAITIDGINVPGKPLQLDGWPGDNMAEGRQYVDAYLNLSEVSGTMGQNAGNAITLEQFAKGYSLFGFNLDPELKHGNYMNLVRRGNVRLEIRFKYALSETMVLIIMGEHLDVIEFDKARNTIVKGI